MGNQNLKSHLFWFKDAISSQLIELSNLSFAARNNSFYQNLRMNYGNKWFVYLQGITQPILAGTSWIALLMNSITIAEVQHILQHVWHYKFTTKVSYKFLSISFSLFFFFLRWPQNYPKEKRCQLETPQSSFHCHSHPHFLG